MENKESLSVILGIFVGLGATLSLQYFLSYYALPWFFSSLGVVFVAIIFIIYISDTGKSTEPWWLLLLNVLAVFLISFIPFSVQKLFLKQTIDPSMASTQFWEGSFQLPKYCFGIQLLLTGSVILSLALIESKKATWKRWIFGMLGVIIFLVGIIVLSIKIPGAI